MYIDNDNFERWMERIFKKVNEIGKDLKSLINTSDVFGENERILDKQDLVFLLKVSYRTLQNYRTNKKLPYFIIGRKTYYRMSDVRNFVREHMDVGTYRAFEKMHPRESGE